MEIFNHVGFKVFYFFCLPTHKCIVGCEKIRLQILYHIIQSRAQYSISCVVLYTEHRQCKYVKTIKTNMYLANSYGISGNTNSQARLPGYV